MASSTSRGCSLIRAIRPVTAISSQAVADVRSALLGSVPTQQVLFQPLSNAEDYQHHRQDQEDQREHQGGVVGALRERQQIAEPARGGDELAHARASESEADRDF